MNSKRTDYDCIVIGGGLAGLVCGITCLSNGLSCAIIASGMSALHFSSGSIDMLGYAPGVQLVRTPFEVMPGFIKDNPDHPYSKCGIDIIKSAFSLTRTELAKASLYLYSNEDLNHFHVTAAGTLKPTYFSQRSVFNRGMVSILEDNPSITILNIRGFMDFNPRLVAANLKRHKLFSGCDIRCAEIVLPELAERSNPVYPLRSIDIARIVDDASTTKDLADRIGAACHKSDIAAMPACLGIERYNEMIAELGNLTDRIVYEIPTLPPSIPGMRLDNALKSRFAAMGGVFITGDTVDKGIMENDRVICIHTSGQNDTIYAKFYVLATGSFFSGGLASGYGRMWEPIFDLALSIPDSTRQIASDTFLAPEGHEFLSAGVKTDSALHPMTKSGKTVENLFCAGAVLAGYNPVAQGCGGGVAIATGYYAAARIVKQFRGT